MNSQFSIKKSFFIEEVLEPVMKIQDSFSIILKDNAFKIICENPLLKMRVKGKLDYDGPEVKLNFADIKKFTRALKFIKDENPIFTFDPEKLVYKSKDGTKFVHHLFDDFKARKATFSEERLDSLKYEIEFILDQAAIKQIIAAAAISNLEEKKVYFYTENGKVFAEINDKAQSKTDSVSLPITDVFTGTNLAPTAIDFNVIRNLSGRDIKVKASKQFFNFERRDEIELNLLTTSFTK